MVKEFRQMLETHSAVFQDCDEMFFEISWLDIPEYCDIMMKFAGNGANRERIRAAFDLWYVWESYPGEISDDYAYTIEETVAKLLDPVDDIARRLLNECIKNNL